MTRFKYLALVLSLALFSSFGFAAKTGRDGDGGDSPPGKKARSAHTEEGDESAHRLSSDEENDEPVVPAVTTKAEYEKARARKFLADLRLHGPRSQLGARAVLGLVTIRLGKYDADLPSDEELAEYLLDDVIPTFGPSTREGARARHMIARMRMTGIGITNESLTLDAVRDLLRAVIYGGTTDSIALKAARNWLARVEAYEAINPVPLVPPLVVPSPMPGPNNRERNDNLSEFVEPPSTQEVPVVDSKPLIPPRPVPNPETAVASPEEEEEDALVPPTRRPSAGTAMQPVVILDDENNAPALYTFDQLLPPAFREHAQQILQGAIRAATLAFMKSLDDGLKRRFP